MHHPASDYAIKYEDTQPLPMGKPRTAEEVGRKILAEHDLDGVEIENNYHARTLPGPDGSDVNTVISDLKRHC